MPPRSEEPPRRAPQARRGASRDLPADDHDEAAERGFGGSIGEARAYTPRGRTVAERDQRTRSPRAGRTTDPFRPSLQVLDGGQPSTRDRHPDDPDHDDSRGGRDRAGRDGTSRTDGDRDGDGREKPGWARIGRDKLSRRADRDRADRDRAERGATGRGGSARVRADRDRPDDEDQRPSRRPAANRGRTEDRDQDRRAGDGVRDRRTGDRGRADDRDQDRDRKRRAGDRGRADDRDRDRRTGDRDRAGDRDRHPGDRGRAGGDRDVAERGDRRMRRTAVQSSGRTTARDSRMRPAGASRTAAVKDRGRRLAVAPLPRRTAGGRPSAPGARPVASVPAAPPKLANSTRRLRLGTVLALALFATIGVRLVVLQVVESPASISQLEKLRDSRIVEVRLPAARGSILDRSGAVLAHSVEARFVYADPKLVKDPAKAADLLSPLLWKSRSQLVTLMSNKKRPGGGDNRFEYLARGVDIGVADQILAMKLEGIGVAPDERRDLPGADLAANLIGFTGEEHTGLEGLEARYDQLLRGTDGSRKFERGNPADGGELAKEIPGGFSQEIPAQPGTSLQLTIDRDLQYQVQGILGEQMKKVNATMGGAVVLDVKTGEVLAQASYPAYNAAKPFSYKQSDRQDVPSSVVTDPGSTHKAFVFGAALQEGIITPDSTLQIGPALRKGGVRFKDSHQQPPGTLMTMPGLLAYSSNVGTIRIADKLTPQKVYEYQQRFGLGQATNEGMPNEATGKILAPDEWSGSAYGSVPIGMSVDATLIQMAAGYNAIANDGTYVQPHLIKSTIDHDGRVTPAPAPETHPVLSPQVAAQLRTMLEAVVDSADATGRAAAVPGFRVAGKTGTAERLVSGVYTSANVGSFIGMAPAESPRFVVAVSAAVPRGSGGEVAAPAFRRIMETTLPHYLVAPTGSKPPTFKIHP